MTIHTLDILIVEDDFSFALELEMLIEKIGYQVLAVVDNSGEALDVIYASKPDLILMDVDIKGRLSGIEIGQKIKHLDIPILYITSFDNEAHFEAAGKSKMLGYLVKPVNKFILKSTINLVVENIRLAKNQTSILENSSENFTKKDHFYFKKKEVYHKVNLTEIAYVMSDDKYCFIHLVKGEKFMLRTTLPQIIGQLPVDSFQRIHRSYIVRWDKISTINFSMGVLNVGEKELPISRTYRKPLQEMMNKISNN